MNLIDKAFLLKKTHLFRALDLDLLLTIADKMELETHGAGSVLFQPGQEGHKLYLIAEGKVEVLNNEKTPLATLSEGAFFGDEALFNEKPRAYGVTAKTPTTVLTLTRTHLLAIVEECPSVGISLLEFYSEKIGFRER